MAYTTAVPKDYSINADGTLVLQIVYFGPDVKEKVLPFSIRQGTVPTQQTLSAEVNGQGAVLNVSETFATFIKTILGQEIAITPVEPPEPTDDDTAVTKFNALIRTWRGLAHLNRDADEIDAAHQDVLAEYDKATETQRARFTDALYVLAR